MISVGYITTFWQKGQYFRYAYHWIKILILRLLKKEYKTDCIRKIKLKFLIKIFLGTSVKKLLKPIFTVNHLSSPARRSKLPEIQSKSLFWMTWRIIFMTLGSSVKLRSWNTTGNLFPKYQCVTGDTKSLFHAEL